MIAAGNGVEPIATRDASDETFTWSATVVPAAIDVWRSTMIAHSWALKNAIAAAEDKATLEAIDMEADCAERPSSRQR